MSGLRAANVHGEFESVSRSAGLSMEHIIEARRRIAPYVRETPLVRSDYLSDLCGGEVYLKLENMQHLNAFKIRGMVNRVLTMSSKEKAKGILVVSSGNHGIAASYCGSLWNIQVGVYVSAMTPSSKIDSIKRFGAKVRVVGENYDEAMRAFRADMEDGAVSGTYVDSSDDPGVVAGYGTIGLEVVEELSEVEQILVPVGGGGLITGVGLAVKADTAATDVKVTNAANAAKAANITNVAKSEGPAVKVIGVQTAACPAMVSSLAEGKPYCEYPSEPSICEALIGGIGRLPYDYADRCIDSVVVTGENAIRGAVSSLLRYEKVVSEPSGAVGVAYILEHPEEFRGKKSVVIISGGNIGLDMLAASVASIGFEAEA